MTTISIEKKKILVTSALPYVNNTPHLGNIIGSVLSGDIFSRFARKTNDVVYICGTDDFGTATELAAKKNKITCEEVVRENKEMMIKVFDWFNLEFDYFGGTSEKHFESKILQADKLIRKNPPQTSEDAFTSQDSSVHTRVVHAIFNKIQSKLIESGKMSQFYCISCEMFLADRYLTGTCKKCKVYGVQGDQCDACGMLLKNEDIVDPECVICSGTPEIRETEHLFLKLHEYTDELKNLYEKFSTGWTKNSREITLTWLQKDLHSRCITRDLKWGISVPGTDKVFYVWFDAVIGYISFFFRYLEISNKKTFNGSVLQIHKGDEIEQNLVEKVKSLNISGLNYEDLKKIFDSYELVQFMGKDNVPFHTIIFPVITDAIASRLSVTEYLLFENKKFSKSKKIGIFGSDLLDGTLGSSDLWRYYLCKIRPESKDSNFSVDDFLNSVSELQNNFGNLCNRVLKFIKNKNQGDVCFENSESEEILGFINSINVHLKSYINEMNKINLKKGLKILSDICQTCNLFLQTVFLKSQTKDEKLNIFSLVFSVIRLLSELYDPFIPDTCKQLKKMCNIEKVDLVEKLEIIKRHKISDDIDVLFVPLEESVIKKLDNIRG